MSDSANAVIAILDECLNEGRFNFDTISERVEDIVNLGLVVRDYNYDEPIDELQDLKGRIEELCGQMNDHFDSLKSIMGEHTEFYQELHEAADNLISQLLSSLENPGDDSLENLRAATEQNAPLELVYKLETMLEQKHANPIIAETDQDTLYMLDAVFGELLFVEAYINGLLDDGDMYRPEKFQEIVNEFHEDVERWRNEDGDEDGNGDEDEDDGEDEDEDEDVDADVDVDEDEDEDEDEGECEDEGEDEGEED
ncbi:hypothetical protein L5515_010130 [Caenorhabditis briggsae]|uniref:Uncharacterized protein n=1 Tax=Caenorhabditis briggsae TaxID=6238 RepID=A0AAE9ER38_CAEBR|nr:hypothetical protein L5515_010130 [Caenorhabditis briggsae]